MHGSDAARQVGLGALEGSFKEGVEVLRSTALVPGGEVALLAGLSYRACWLRERGGGHLSPLPAVWHAGGAGESAWCADRNGCEEYSEVVRAGRCVTR